MSDVIRSEDKVRRITFRIGQNTIQRAVAELIRREAPDVKAPLETCVFDEEIQVSGDPKVYVTLVFEERLS